MILLLLNSFCGFFFQSLIVKAACLRMQSDYLGSTLVLSFLYLGFARGCRLSRNKSLKRQERSLLFLASTLPLLMVRIGTQIEMAPALLVSLKAKLEAWSLASDTLTLFTLAGLALIFVVGFASGYEMVCLYNVVAQKKAKTVIALSYFGALFAGLLASFYSFQHDFFLRDLCFLAVIYLSTGVYFLIRFQQPMLTRVLAAACLAGSSIFIWHTYSRTSDLKEISRGVLYGRTTAADWIQARDPKVETFTSRFQRLDIVRFQNPNPYFQLFLNEDFQFDSVDHGLYHQTFLKGALHFKPAERDVHHILILGGGDGLLAAALFKDLGENIDLTLVELDPKVTELAQEKWPNLTDGVFSKNMHVIYDDAFRFLRQNPNQYDAIFMDFPDPKSFDTSKLYSVEMYQMARKVLKENGFITLDFPFANSQTVLVSTLDAAGFRNQIFFGSGHKFFYADQLPARPEMADLALKSPVPVQSAVTPDPNAVNSIFKPRLPESL